jgi:hypothetical protein
MKRVQESKSVSAASVVGLLLVPMLFAAVSVFALFFHQSSAFADTFFTGNWKTLMQIVLWVEAFVPTVVCAIQAMALGIGAATATGFNLSLLEGILCLVFTSGVFGWGFWWLLTGTANILGLGGNALASGLIVYLFLLPLCIGFSFFVAIIGNACITMLTEPAKKK